MRVGDEWREWPAHECVVFDDSFEHEVRICVQLVPQHFDMMHLGRLLLNIKCLLQVRYEDETPERGKGERVVLLLDIWHPDMTDEERSAVEALFPA